MSGTKAGGLKTAATNKALYGIDHYKRAGAIGGLAKVPKGFALMDKKKVRAAGKKGGSTSRKTIVIGEHIG
jgi:general stress protein YciG